MDVDVLKGKVTKEFNDLICKIKKGYRPDYEFLLEEISFIDLINNIDKKLLLIALQYYINGRHNINSWKG